jgi:ABC-2 type transport system permease protein
MNRRVLHVARREYIATVCTKGFILGLVLAPVMMFGGLLGIAVMERQDRGVRRTLGVIDRSGIVADAILKAAADHNESQAARKRGATYNVEIIPPDPDPPRQLLELSDRIRSGRLHAFVEIGREVLHPKGNSPDSRIRYHAKNPALDDLRGWVANVINEHLRHSRLLEAGIDPAAIDDVFARVDVEGMSLVSRDARTGAVQGAERQNELVAVGVPFGVSILAMMLVLMGASPLLQSVMEEKTQRIAEVMLGAATPWELMLGKVIGGVAVSLTAMAVYLSVAFTGLGSVAALAFVPWNILPWFVTYVVAAILMFGAIGAALGSACNDAKDAQHMQLPLMIPMILPMFLLMPLVKEPQGGLATGLSLFPPFTPLLMLLRISAPGGIPWWQPWVGMAGVLIFTAAALWLGARIFRVGILMQGKPPNLMQILRWGFRG